MTMPATGSVISFSDLQTVFGGTNPIDMDEYYQNASTGYTNGVSGIPNINSTISLDMFYGKSKTPLITSVHNAGANFTFRNIGATALVFGIKALRNIKIVGFDIKPNYTNTTFITRNVDFYYRFGVVTDPNIIDSLTNHGWTFITSGSLTYNRDIIQIPTDTFNPPFFINIDQNVNVCIAIRFPPHVPPVTPAGGIAYDTPAGAGAVWTGALGDTTSTEPGVFEVKAGIGASVLPAPPPGFSNRVFIGKIRYQLR